MMIDELNFIFSKFKKISIIQYIDIYLKINKILLTIIYWIKQRDY